MSERLRLGTDDAVIGDDRGMPDTWTCHHFSLSNALDDRPGDLPHLLRRVADEIERRQILAMDLLDVTISQETTADGPWWAVTVYWSPDRASS